MPKLTIDGRSIEVPAGTKVIEAAERLGIFIPRLCYHPALGSVGACRLCACSFLEGPVRGVNMSCMVDAQDGMVVSTTHADAVEFRRQVIEWLMANHPHDCPVCDEGGHCLLQEVTLSGGHGVRRYTGKKRTYRDQDLGPFVQQEMNRCIHCYRCRRFYQEVAGGRDLGALGDADRTCFGRFSDGALESPFSGNLIDLCPTGVFTDKVARFQGRRWEFQRSPSLCVGCSLVCSTVVSARFREVVRVESGVSETVNGHFICDRGRFGFGYTNAPDRPRRATIRGREAGFSEAFDAAASSLRALPPGQVACVGSARSSLETQAALARLCQTAGWAAPSFFVHERERLGAARAVAALSPETAVSLRDLEQADFLLVAGVDPLEDAPLLALSLRQAWRRGATVAFLGPEVPTAPLDFVHLPTVEAEVPQRLTELAEQVSRGEGSRGPLTAGLVRSRHPVVVCGTRDGELPAHAARAVEALRAARGKAGLFCVLSGANAFGAASVSPEAPSVTSLLSEIDAGRVRGLIVCEAAPLKRALYPLRAEAGLRALEFLLVLNHRLTPAAEMATVFLPTQTVFETGGTYVNQAGQVRQAAPVHGGGTPIAQTGRGDHPPREFRRDVPGGEPVAAAAALNELAARLAPGERDLLAEDALSWLRRERPQVWRLAALTGPTR